MKYVLENLRLGNTLKFYRLLRVEGYFKYMSLQAP